MDSKALGDGTRGGGTRNRLSVPMPCEETPSRYAWSWNTTVRDVPPVVAAVAAILTGVVAAAFGQSAGQSLVMALLVGAGTFVAMFVYHYVRAPGDIARDRERRLTEWRARYAVRVQQYPTKRDEVEVHVTADRGPDLDGLWCEVEHRGQRYESRTPVPSGPGIEMGPGAGRWALWWAYPQSFDAGTLDRGHYRATVFMREHAEPVGSTEWDIGETAGR
jgi:hypothetical protein